MNPRSEELRTLLVQLKTKQRRSTAPRTGVGDRIACIVTRAVLELKMVKESKGFGKLQRRERS